MTKKAMKEAAKEMKEAGGKRKVEVQDESGTRLRLEVGRTETTNEEAEYQAYLANAGGPDPRD